MLNVEANTNCATAQFLRWLIDPDSLTKYYKVNGQTNTLFEILSQYVSSTNILGLKRFRPPTTT